MGGRYRVLLVETDPEFRHLLEQVAGPISDLESVGDFQSARTFALDGTFALVVTNLRLRAHNGLHLVYLMRSSLLSTRAIVYSDHSDPFLAREGQRAGAFYEPMARVPYSLPAYLRAELPVFDRRDPQVQDRRTSYRGGRRRSDVPLSTAARAFGV